MGQWDEDLLTYISMEEEPAYYNVQDAIAFYGIQHPLGFKCPDCRIGFVEDKTTKRGTVFLGCTRFPVCKWRQWLS